MYYEIDRMPSAHILEAESVGVIPILYGNNPDYGGYQTENWDEIPAMIQKIITKKITKG